MNRKLKLTLVAAVLAVLPWACTPAAKQPPQNGEDIVNAWKAMEKQAQGHSPRGQFQLADPPTVIDSPGDLDGRQRDSQHALPATRMSLRMHNADIVAVLQALARAAGRSIVLAPGVSGTVNVNIVDRPWDEVFKGMLAANKLIYGFDGETIRVMAKEDLQGALDVETIRRKTLVERTAALKEAPLATTVAKVRFADAKLLKPTVEKTLARDKEGKTVGNVEVDELTNSLIIMSVESDIPKMTKLLAKLDEPRSQIKLKAHIVETTKEVARDLGIMWGGLTTNKMGAGNNNTLYTIPGGTSTGTGTFDGKYTSVLGSGVSNQGMGMRFPASTVTNSQTGAALGLMYGKYGANILEMQLQALATEKKLNIISSPSISTMDNQKAYTESGEKVPYQAITGTGTSATTSVLFQDAVLRLEITPHIIDEQLIKLQVLIQKDEVDTSRTVAGNPYIVKKKTETTLIARDGETVVISGLSKLRKQMNEAGVPGVKDLPGVGWLAKSEYKDDLKDEFMIFITPEVLADWRAGERQKTYEELEREQNPEAQAPAVSQNGAAPKSPAPAQMEQAPAASSQAPARAVEPQKPTASQTPLQNGTGQIAQSSLTPDTTPTEDQALLYARPRKPALGGRL